MILAIDVGNTNIVLGCIEEGEVIHVFRIQTEPGRTEMEYAIKIKQLMELYGLEEKAFEGAILSSVVPPVTGAVASAVKLLTGCDCLVVGPGVKTGLNIRIDDPAVQAAYERYLAARVEVYGEEKAAKRPQTLMDIATIGAKTLKKRGLLPELDESEEINACSIRLTADVDGSGNVDLRDALLIFQHEAGWSVTFQ